MDPFSFKGQPAELRNGSVVIAAITSCTNTSNPSVMLGAALVRLGSCSVQCGDAPGLCCAVPCRAMLCGAILCRTSPALCKLLVRTCH